MTFKKQNYMVIKNLASKELSNFLFNYFCMKRVVAKTLFEERYLSPYAEEWGIWTDPQVLNTYCNYGDVAMETLLEKTRPDIEKHTGLELVPMYSFARLYKKGDVLERHKDRFSCQVSVTIFLGGDSWPIYLEPSGKLNKKGIEINLQQGDALLYAGCKVEHWREEFQGENCGQVFLHYNTPKVAQKNNNLFDGRSHLGLPTFFRK